MEIMEWHYDIVWLWGVITMDIYLRLALTMDIWDYGIALSYGLALGVITMDIDI